MPRLVLFSLTLLVLGLHASATEDAKKIDELIRQLGDRRYPVRKAATEVLEKIGESARKKLTEVANSKTDIEVAARARSILRTLDARKYDPEIDVLIAQLASASFRERETASAKLVQKGPAASKQLEQAVRSNDIEIRLRAQAILRLIGPPPRK